MTIDSIFWLFDFTNQKSCVGFGNILKFSNPKLFVLNEVKSSKTINKKDISGLLELQSIAGKDFKKGIALMPICFGISFTNTPMNNARALVHVYQDGSIGISTGAVEMGQGVNTKLITIAAQSFSIAPEKIKIETTNTTRVANTSPTAASSTADLNGKAVQMACSALLERLKKVAADQLKSTSEEIQPLKLAQNKG